MTNYAKVTLWVPIGEGDEEVVADAMEVMGFGVGKTPDEIGRIGASAKIACVGRRVEATRGGDLAMLLAAQDDAARELAEEPDAEHGVEEESSRGDGVRENASIRCRCGWTDEAVGVEASAIVRVAFGNHLLAVGGAP